MYVIREMQTSADGTIAHLPPVNVKEAYEADSVYYQKLSAAAISPVPIHTVCLETEEGYQLNHKSFHHGGADVPETFAIFEVQASAESVAHLPAVNETDPLHAESTFYNKASYAAVSTVLRHTAILENNKGEQLMRICYRHTPTPVITEMPTEEVPQEEPQEDEEE